ncbi:MAG: multiphosphoryl transfer protein [Solirubrobacterales bacterium]|nr:multiphosphoryl transfer protein [Solirubrobacterales bacterium]
MGRRLAGLAASPGSAAGRARLLGGEIVTTDAEPVPDERRPGEERRALQALERAAEEILAIAARMRENAQDEEAEIVETGALLAADPGLRLAVSAAVRDRGLEATAAIHEASEVQADLIGRLDDPRLAERADDVRSIGRRAVEILAPGGRQQPGHAGNGGAQVLVASDLGPADVAQLGPNIAAIALAAGGVSAHAAIVARSLGIPMVVGVGSELLGVAGGEELVVDGTAGRILVAPEQRAVEEATREIEARTEQRRRSRESRDLPAITEDGRRIRVLANAVGAPEVEVALAAGAEGVGLLRTELAFLESSGWPDEEEHRRHLAPVLGLLEGRSATVRVLDFGGDKTPPFLRGESRRGIELMLAHPDALAAQLRAVLGAAGGIDLDLRLMLPMVESVEQVDLVRAPLLRALDEVPDGSAPKLGAMIETTAGVELAAAIAASVDFLSIGTNDLTHSILGRDRFDSGHAPTHDPRVLRAIAAVAEAARGAGVPIEVCGEAASSPIGAPLLIGAEIDELSVGAARVGTVRSWVRSLRHTELRELEAAARQASTSAEVESLLADQSRRLERLE